MSKIDPNKIFWMGSLNKRVIFNASVFNPLFVSDSIQYALTYANGHTKYSNVQNQFNGFIHKITFNENSLNACDYTQSQLSKLCFPKILNQMFVDLYPLPIAFLEECIQYLKIIRKSKNITSFNDAIQFFTDELIDDQSFNRIMSRDSMKKLSFRHINKDDLHQMLIEFIVWLKDMSSVYGDFESDFCKQVNYNGEGYDDRPSLYVLIGGSIYSALYQNGFTCTVSIEDLSDSQMFNKRITTNFTNLPNNLVYCIGIFNYNSIANMQFKAINGYEANEKYIKEQNMVKYSKEQLNEAINYWTNVLLTMQK